MTFTVFAVETVTGRNLGPLDCALRSWARVLNGSETAAVELMPHSDGSGLSAATKADFRSWTEPARMSLVIDWDGIPLWAGPVWNRVRNTSSVTVSCAGLSTIFTRRKAIDPALTLNTQVLSYSGLSLATIARRLVQFSIARTGGRLPVTYAQTDETDSDTTHVRNYPGSDLSTIGDLLSNLTGVIGGPDIDFRPVWTDSSRSTLQWQMVTGTAAAPQITSASQLAWEFGTPLAGVRDITVTEDASAMATDQWAKGTGSGTGTLMSHAASRTYLDLGWPLLEAEADYTSVSVQATLDAHTAGDLAAVSVPLTQWDLTVDAYSDPALGTYQLGDLPTVHVAGDFWIPDGTYGMRIVGFSGDQSTGVKVSVQNASSRALDIPGSPGDSLPARVRELERQLRSSDQ